LRWKDWLVPELGDDFDVLLPFMPNGSNAQYGEWKIWFEKILNLLDDDAIFIGHSLGGIFLVKYFSENDSIRKIKAAILVAPPCDGEGGIEKMASFTLTASLERFAQQCKKIYLLQSQDDPVVPFAQVEKYKNALPKAQTVIFKDRGHFNLETFPEMVDLIKKIVV